MDDVHEFNTQFDLTYHLGHNDCRDYASRLVSHLAGVKVAPGMISWFINSSPTRNLCHGDILELVASNARGPRASRTRSRLSMAW
jgi:hypothetical protein